MDLHTENAGKKKTFPTGNTPTELFRRCLWNMQ
jgi:hypothetical protein